MRAPAGPEGGGSRRPALTMMLPLHDLPLPGLPQLRTAGTEAPPPPYTGGGTGAPGRAAPPERERESSVRLHKFAYIAHICMHLHRCGGAARQPTGCIGGGHRGAASLRPPPAGATGDPGVPSRGGQGGVRVGLATLASLGRGASAEGQRWHLLAGCPAGARYHPGVNQGRLWEPRKESQQRTWLRSSLLVGGGADVIPGQARRWVSASRPRSQ